MINQLPLQYKQRIQKYFTNQSIAQHLIQQLASIYNSQIASQNVIAVSIQGIHLYINFHKRSLKSQQTQQNSNPKLSQMDQSKNKDKQVDVFKQTKQNEQKLDMESSGCYAIKITKLFPLPHGVRLYILNNCYQPRLFDCRDVLDEVLGMPWKHTNSILDIFTNIDKFQKKLFGRSNQNLAMQMTGQFKLQDTFSIDQLHKFSSMQLFPDLTNQNSTLLSTTQTHLLTLKKIPSPSTATPIYQIVRVCNYQCISQVYHNKKEREIIISINKYRSIKSFEQVQKISRKYILQDTQLFIRDVLKNICKFQKVQMCLQLGSGWGEEKIEKRLGVIRKMEGELGEIGVGKRKKEVIGQLGQQYQKVIEYFLERANPYYLLYVPKLNKIYELQSTP